MKVRACLSLVSLLVAATPTTGRADPLPAPHLVVVIAVDQFSSDLFNEYRPSWTAGLRRLSEGAVFPAGYQSHAATETCPGHSTILTGSHPARTGIIANEWFDQSLLRADKKVYCSEDPDAFGSSGGHYTVSPQALRVPTLGDRLKSQNPASRVVAVAGKDRAALMLGGHAIDEAWFWGGSGFVTVPGRASPVPEPVAAVNAKVRDALAARFVPPLPDACRSRAVPVAVGDRTVGTLRDRAVGDARGFRVTPEFDEVTMDLAIGLLQAMRLGHGPATDVLAVGLSATDAVGHSFGTEGAEMCAQLLGVDRQVGRLLTALDAEGVPYVVALTADHGGNDVPERSRERGFPDAQRVDPALDPGTLGARLGQQLGITGPILLGTGPFGDLYIANSVPVSARARVLEAARRYYLAHPQVAAVFTKGEIAARPPPTGPVDEWSLADRVRASFDPARSGDLIVELKPHVTPISEPGSYVATHGSPWNYDRRVPILIYQPGRPGFEQPLPVETVDILPTLAALVGLPIPPAEIDGRCLDLNRGGGSSCPLIVR